MRWYYQAFIRHRGQITLVTKATSTLVSKDLISMLLIIFELEVGFSYQFATAISSIYLRLTRYNPTQLSTSTDSKRLYRRVVIKDSRIFTN